MRNCEKQSPQDTSNYPVTLLDLPVKKLINNFDNLQQFQQRNGDKIIDLSEQSDVKVTASPFVKWAGGKRKLVSAILALAPSKFERYLEPFVGGGAVALALNHQSMLLNDANSELIAAYRMIRDNLDGLLQILNEHQVVHSETFFDITKKKSIETLTELEQAARFIYLNKTCFNGLYRVNRKGEFNVPSGKYTNPTLYNPSNLLNVSKVLSNATLFNEDYESFLKTHARSGDFIYLDPPYIPVSQYSDFKRYTKAQFHEADQRLLAHLFTELIELGAYPILSNSYSDLALELYQAHNIQVIYAGRNINHDGTGRGPVREILVTPRL